MKSVIYLRKSRADAEAEARGEGETLARHEKILMEVAKKQKLQVFEIYKEIVSGETISSRPVVQKLLSEVEQGMWEAVLVVEVERLARGDTIDQGIMAQAFKYSGTKIITPLKTYDPSNEFDEEFFEFGLFMSRREYKTINRRLQQGRSTSIKEGKYVGNKAPYGYTRQKLEKEKGFTLAPHPDEAPVVKMIFDLYTKGDHGERIGISLIVRKLNNLNIPARMGPWSNATIQGIIRNPVYIGKIRWGARKTVKKVIDGQITKTRPRAAEYILSDGKHEPIIDEETFRLANAYINSNRARPNPKQVECKNPLSGVVECGMCGHKMIRRPYSKRGQADTLLCPYTHCSNVSAPLYLVENVILNQISLIVKEDIIKTHIDIDILEKSLKTAKENIRLIKSQLEKAYDFLEQGVYDIDVFLSRSKTLQEKMTAELKNCETLENEIKHVQSLEKMHSNITPILSNFINTYNSANTPAAKNDLLKQVIQKAVYLKNTKGVRGNNPNDFQITLYPKISVI